MTLTDENIRGVPQRAFWQDPVDVLRTIFGPCRPEAHVAFGSRRPLKSGEAAPRWLAHMSVGELLTGRDGKLDLILAYRLDQTQYVVWNPLRLSREWLAKQGLPETDEPAYFPVKRETVSQVRALYVDLDVGAGPTRSPELATMSPEGAIAALLVTGDRWGVPPASLVGISGRGAYAIWLIHPLDIVGPVEKDRVALTWETTEKQLIRRLGNLGADPAAGRIMNWLKRPGTLDTKTGRTVEYFALVPDGTPIPEYNLDEILKATMPGRLPPRGGKSRVRVTVFADGSESREWLRPMTPPRPDRTTPRKGPRKPYRVALAMAPSLRRIADLLRLNRERPMEEGSRRRFLYVLTVATTEAALRRTHCMADAEWEALADAREANRLFRPPLTDTAVIASVRSIIDGLRRGKRYRISRAGAARILGVTDEEAKRLDLRSLAPQTLQTARRRAEEDRRGAKKARKELLGDLHAEGFSTPAIVWATGYSRATVERQRAELWRVERLRARRSERAGRPSFPSVSSSPPGALEASEEGRGATLAERDLPTPLLP